MSEETSISCKWGNVHEQVSIADMQTVSSSGFAVANALLRKRYRKQISRAEAALENLYTLALAIEQLNDSPTQSN